MSDSGMHQHSGFNRETGVTSLDGAHSHEFRLPDGTAVQTSEDGGHAHALDEAEVMHSVHGGVHAHTLVVDGVALRTEVDGWHQHQVGEVTIAPGGLHSHALVLPTGETVISLYVSTEKSGAKRGSERRRSPVTEAHLSAVETRAFAVLSQLRKSGAKTEKQLAAERFFESDDIAPPRISVIKYDPVTRKIIR